MLSFTDILNLVDEIVKNMIQNNVEFLELEHKEQEKTLFKVRLVKEKKEKYKKGKSIFEKPLETKTEKQEKKEITKDIIERENFEIEESEDLGGFKLKFINKKQFYIISTCVGKVRLNHAILTPDNVIEIKTKLAEIEILNIVNVVSLNFKAKLLNVLVKNEEIVDYGKNLFFMEKLEVDGE